MTAAPAPRLPDGSARRPEVDAVRGLVMIVMALDHARDFLGNAHFDATDLAQTTAPIFVSRWITHFCAPTFFLLAGMSACLSIRSGRRTVGESPIPRRALPPRPATLETFAALYPACRWYGTRRLR